MDRSPHLRLGQRKLVANTVEVVRAVLNAVRPRHEHGPVRAVGHALDVVRLEDVTVALAIGAHTAADLDDRGALRPGDDLDLLAGGGYRHAVAGRHPGNATARSQEATRRRPGDD